MELQYLNTNDLCTRYRCSPRTIFRKLRRPVNPMPAPVIKTVGSSNLWLVEDILDWDTSEIRRTLDESVSNNGTTH